MGVLFALPYLVYGLKKKAETEPKLSPYALKASFQTSTLT